MPPDNHKTPGYASGWALAYMLRALGVVYMFAQMAVSRAVYVLGTQSILTVRRMLGEFYRPGAPYDATRFAVWLVSAWIFVTAWLWVVFLWGGADIVEAILNQAEDSRIIRFLIYDEMNKRDVQNRRRHT